MCTGKCALCIAITLYPLVLLSLICNTLLFFPDWDVKYAKEGHITETVHYMGGFIGGGVLVLIAALYIHLTGQQGCCGDRIEMLFSIVFAAVGVAGAVYSFIVALLGLANGPLCKGTDGKWDMPFKNSHMNYMTDAQWADCEEPKNVVQFNMGLFIVLMATSVLQGLLCATQMINGLIGCLCGTCSQDKQTQS